MLGASDGYGYGYGHGGGDGDGDGYGYGYGYGYGGGDGDGYGHGGGDGYGYGGGDGYDYLDDVEPIALGPTIGAYIVEHLPWGLFRVGCQVHTLKTWEERAVRIAAENGFDSDHAQIGPVLEWAREQEQKENQKWQVSTK